MKKFRSIGDVYSTGKRYIEAEIPRYQQSNTLSDSYNLVAESVNANVLSPEAIELITGVPADIIINYYRSIKQDGSLKHVLNNTTVLVGSPVYRAVNVDLNGKGYSDLALYVKEIGEQKERSLKITTAGTTKKLRTPSGGRICVWAPAYNRIEELSNPTENPIEDINDINLYRVLSIVHLMHELGNHLEQVNKMPAGISYEIDQIDTFNSDLAELPDMGFILPGTNDLYRDNDGQVVLISRATNIKGTPKADMALSLGNDDVFWISYKHGKYTEDVTKPSEIPFQQYGSPGNIYGDEDLKPVVDKFLTAVSSEIDNYYTREDVIRIGEQNEDATHGSLEHLLNTYGKQLSRTTNKGTLYKNIFNKNKVDHFYIYPSGTPEIGAKLFDQDRKPLGSKLELLGLKSIYGDDYDGKGSSFGKNNVNILLQTPQSAKMEIMRGTPDDLDEAIAVRMTMVEGSHIIKNPDLPDSVPYLPCMYMRHTMENYFIFNNNLTGRTECILGGRLLIYPQGSASVNSKWIDIFED